MKRSYLLLCTALLCTNFVGCLDDSNNENEDKEKMVEMTIYPETGFGAMVSFRK